MVDSILCSKLPDLMMREVLMKHCAAGTAAAAAAAAAVSEERWTHQTLPVTSHHWHRGH